MGKAKARNFRRSILTGDCYPGRGATTAASRSAILQIAPWYSPIEQELFRGNGNTRLNSAIPSGVALPGVVRGMGGSPAL